MEDGNEFGGISVNVHTEGVKFIVKIFDIFVVFGAFEDEMFDEVGDSFEVWWFDGRAAEDDDSDEGEFWVAVFFVGNFYFGFHYDR